MGYISAFKHAVLGIKKPESPTSTQAIVDELRSWVIRNHEVDTFLDLSKRSLDEVTRLTGYEDEKANRILTAMAFLSALDGVLFASFVDKYHALLWSSSWLVSLVYGFFFLYILLLSLGAICVVYAVQPRFNVPSDWGKGSGPLGSFLFFKQIIQVTPKTWTQAFSGQTGADLKNEYVKNAIFETYLIAEKVRDKLEYLEPGVNLLTWSTRILLGWVILYVFTVIFVQIPEKAEDLAPRLTVLEERNKQINDRLQHIDQHLTTQQNNVETLKQSLQKTSTDLMTRLDTLTTRLDRAQRELSSQQKSETRVKRTKKTNGKS